MCIQVPLDYKRVTDGKLFTDGGNECWLLPGISVEWETERTNSEARQ